MNDEPDIDNVTPLWRFVTKVGMNNVGGGGNQNIKCNFCEFTFQGTYSRVRAHLLRISSWGVRKCMKVSTDRINEFKILEEEANRRKENRPKHVPLPSSVGSSSQFSSQSQSTSLDSLSNFSLRQRGYEPKKRKKTCDSAIEKAFNMQAKEELDGEIARMFYSAGLPFNLARNPHFIMAFMLAVRCKLTNYVPPSYNALRTKLLDREKNNINMLLEPTKNTWPLKGVSIVCDGWTDPQRRPLINFIVINESGTMFIHAVNCEGERKDKVFISNLIKEVITEVGASNVVQVITDNAPVCRAAGLLVEQSYPHIFWTPCVVHTLNLALKNICAARNSEANEITYDECAWISKVTKDVVKIRNFIMNHSMRLSMFNKFSKLKFLAVAETQFASMIVMLKRFKDIKSELKSMVVSEEWSLYRDDDPTMARDVREKLLDLEWWDMIDYILAFTEPIYSMLRACDTDKPCLHLVYENWDTMIFQVKKIIYQNENKRDFEESTFWNVVQKVLEDRWSKSNNALHSLAHSLNPRCTTKEWKDKYPHVTPLQCDVEVSKMRKICLKRMFPSEELRSEANEELARFFGCLEDLGDEDSIRDRWKMEPLKWWLIHGSGAPNLQKLCMKLLGHVSSSSCSERNWSTYSFIQNPSRNQIKPTRANDMVFVHSNLRLLSRRTTMYMQGESKMWDVGGDAFEFDDVGTLAIADLSLDEPELESIFFIDEHNEVPNEEPDEIANMDGGSLFASN